MAELRRQRIPMNWMPTNTSTWTNHRGCKLILKDDVIIYVSNLENRIMRKIAIDTLDRQHDIYIRNCGEDPSTPKKGLQANMYKYLSSISKPNTFNIFGLDLEITTLIECSRFTYRRPLANNQFKLQVPRFFVESIKFIEKYGTTTSGIFQRGGASFRPCEVAYQILRGDVYNVNINTDVLEVAAVLKYYLENMPEGLFTEALEYQFVKAIGFDVQNRVKALNWLLQALPQENREALYLLVALFRKITRSEGSGMESHSLNDIFSPILFRYRTIVDNKCMGVIQVLIEYFPVVFILKARQLDRIYTQMSAIYPTKVDEHMYRRSHQCHCKTSDIPPDLRILSNQMRTYNTCKTDSYYHLEFKPRSTNYTDTHILNTTSYLLLMQSIMNNEDPEEYEATDDINQFPGFEMVEIAPKPSSPQTESSDCKWQFNILRPVTEAEEEDDIPYDPGMDNQSENVRVGQLLNETKDDGSYSKPGNAALQTLTEDEDNTTDEQPYDPRIVVSTISRTYYNNMQKKTSLVLPVAETGTQIGKLNLL